MSSFYKMDPAAWDFGTAGLSLEEEAAYLRIINAIHKHDGPVPNIDRVLAGMFRCSTRKARALIDALIAAGKITIEGGQIWNDRARSDMVQRGFVSISRAEMGAKGGRTRAENAAKALKEKETCQAVASSRIEENRIEKKEEDPPYSPPCRGDELEPPLAASLPSIDPVPARKRRKSALTPELAAEFATVWPHYPRKSGYGAAETAWGKARAAASYATITGPLGQFVRAVRGLEPDRIPHFSTWLNQRRWLDDQSHARNGPRTSTDDLRELSTLSSSDDLANLLPATPALRVIR